MTQRLSGSKRYGGHFHGRPRRFSHMYATSPAAPSRGDAAARRRQSRVGCGLTAAIADPAGGFRRFRILDISLAGMRLEGLPAAVGPEVDFSLEARWVLGTGRGRVVHRSNGTAGVAVDQWYGRLAGIVRGIVCSGLLAESTWRELYVGELMPER